MAFTIDQCKKVIRLQDMIDNIKFMDIQAPAEFNKRAKVVIKELENEIEKLLFKKPR